MADSTLRLVITGSSAGATKAFAETAAAAETTGGKIGSEMEKATSRAGGAFSKLSSIGQSWGIPFASSLDNVGKKLDETGGKASTFADHLSKIGGVTLAAAAGGFVAVAAESVHLAEGFDKATGSIAASADISQASAKKIGDAFLTTGGQTTFSATQIATAYAQVAGQLGDTQGKALSASQALSVMKTATDLAEASGTDLNTATSALSATMQAYQIKAGGAANASNILFNTARITGTGVDNVSSTVDKLKTKLGDLAPSLQDTSGLIADLAAHGETGRFAISAVSTAFTNLLKPATIAAGTSRDLTSQQDSLAKANLAVQAAQEKLNTAVSGSGAKTKDLTAQQNALAAANISVSAAQDKLNAAQSAEQSKPTAAGASAVTQAQLAVQKATLGAQTAQDRLTQAQAASPSTTTAVTSAQLALQNAQLSQKTAADALSKAQDNLNGKMTAAQQEAQTLGVKLKDSQGNFIGIPTLLGEVSKAEDGMTASQKRAADAQLFGATAADKIASIINAGPAAYQKYADGVAKAGSAHTAAERATNNLHGQMEKLKSEVEDLGTRFGEALIPKLEDAAKFLSSTVTWFEKNKTAAEALGVIIGGTLATAVGVFTYGKLADMAKGVRGIYNDVGTLVNKLSGLTLPGAKVTGEAGTPGASGTVTVDGAPAATTIQDAIVTGGNTAAAAIRDAMAAGGTTAGSELATGETTGATGAATEIGAAEKAAGLTTAGELATGEEAGGLKAATELGAGEKAGATTAAEELGAGEKAGAVTAGSTIATEEGIGGAAAGAGFLTKALPFGPIVGTAIGVGITDLLGHGLQKIFPDPESYGHRLGVAMTPTGFLSDLQKFADNVKTIDSAHGRFAAASGILPGAPGTTTTENDEGDQLTKLGTSATQLSAAAQYLQSLQSRVGKETGQKAEVDQSQINELIIAFSKTGQPAISSAESADQRQAGTEQTKAAQQLEAAATSHGKAAQQHLVAAAADTKAANQAEQAADALKKINFTKPSDDLSSSAKAGSTAAQHQTTAAKDQSTAAKDETTAAKDHTQAAAKHEQAATDLKKAASEQTQGAHALVQTFNNYQPTIGELDKAATQHLTAAAKLTASGDKLNDNGDKLDASSTKAKEAAVKSEDATSKWVAAFNPIAPKWMDATTAHKAAAEKHQTAANTEQDAATKLKGSGDGFTTAANNQTTAANHLDTAASNLSAASSTLGSNIHVTINQPAAPAGVGQLLNPNNTLTAAGATSALKAAGFAEGGIISSPTLALMGEAGTEAVIPANDPQRAFQLLRQLYPNAQELAAGGLVGVGASVGSAPSVGSSSGGNVTIVVQSVLDGKVIAQAVASNPQLASTLLRAGRGRVGGVVVQT